MIQRRDSRIFASVEFARSRRVCGKRLFLTFFEDVSNLRSSCALLAAVLMASSLAAQLPAPTGLPGQAVFAARCAVCHGDEGQGVSARITIAGPSLQAEHNVRAVISAVRDGRGVMPSFGRVLRYQDIDDVSRYITGQLATIPLSGGNLSEGGILFRTHCAACHRTAVRGGALVMVQTNAPALDTQSAAIIAGAIRSGPGPMPVFPPALMSDQQLASIVDYVQFVQHPPNPGGNPLHWYGPVVEGLVACIMLCAITAIAMWIEKGGRG
jgi:ubiquinol-cytochrome c reductase cytochrome c subunit